MAVSRLIQRRSSLRINRCEFSKPVRWFSSYSSVSEIEKPIQSKKRGVPKRERALAAESFVKEYMEKNSGLFPKVAHIQNEVGGSWYTVKEIVSNIKATMVGTTQPENCHIVNASTHAKDSAVTKVVESQYEPGSETDLCGHLKSTFEAETVQQGEDKEGNTEYSTGMAGEFISHLTVDPVSDATSMNRPSSSFEHDKLNFTGSLLQEEANTTFRPSSNSSGNMSTKFGMHSAPEGLTNSSNLFKLADCLAVPGANNRKGRTEGLLSDILKGHKLNRNPQGRTLVSPGISKKINSFSNRPDLHANTLLSSSSEVQPGLRTAASREVNDTVMTLPESFTVSKNTAGLEGMKQLITKASESVRGKNRDNSMHNINRYLEQPMLKDETIRDDIKDIVNSFKELMGGSSTDIANNTVLSSKNEESCKKSPVVSQSIATLYYKKKERNYSAECPDIHSETNPDGSIKVLTTGWMTQVAERSSKEDKTTGHSQLSVMTDKGELHKTLGKCSTRDKIREHKAVVKFITRSVKEKDIVSAFKTCGDIQEVKFSTPEGFFRNADVYFKKRDGLLNALKRIDVAVRGVNVIVEADAAARENISSRISIPSLIGDPDVPAALVKNPTRTVKIELSTSGINSHDIVAALQSKENNVTGFFFGSSNSVFVEFENEDDKEAILTRNSIDVLDKQLLVSRIDVPRTTCVRISFHKPDYTQKVAKVYTSLGEIFYSRSRSPWIIDVQYKITEWPNMWKILNRLNGTKVNGHKLRAEPATVIPAPILKVLWRHPEERIHVENCVRRLLQKLDEHVVHTADLADLPNFYRRD